jgi:hypothetical protein
MERQLELITKKKLEEEIIIIKKKKKDLEINNKIKELLLLKNKHIILLYEKKLELYKKLLDNPEREEENKLIKELEKLKDDKGLLDTIHDHMD